MSSRPAALEIGRVDFVGRLILLTIALAIFTSGACIGWASAIPPLPKTDREETRTDG